MRNPGRGKLLLGEGRRWVEWGQEGFGVWRRDESTRGRAKHPKKKVLQEVRRAQPLGNVSRLAV